VHGRLEIAWAAGRVDCHDQEVDSDLELATVIDTAHRQGRLLDAAAQQPLDLAAAYAVQRRLTALRTARGAARIGFKLGYTSQVMREQMGVDQPNHGPLLDTMRITDGRLPADLIHPRVEPEIALVLGEDLRPVAAHAALEVVDSIWRDYRFTLELNTADGSSAAGLVLGPPLLMEGLDALPVRLTRNGELVGEGTGAAAMGHPLLALEWLQRALAGTDDRLRAGDVVITGGLTAAVPLDEGDVVAADFGDGTATVALRRA
jgi:2-keto-4-pentenoate hydratase